MLSVMTVKLFQTGMLEISYLPFKILVLSCTLLDIPSKLIVIMI